ncbi:hypothetical protein DUP91_28255, partial [Salmonella enterica subsp. enterica]|nr:hypothetical protein [Salmonella enterica subsp. enterica]
RVLEQPATVSADTSAAAVRPIFADAIFQFSVFDQPPRLPSQTPLGCDLFRKQSRFLVKMG